MKTNLRGKIREFIQSEEGKVGVKTPLTLGAAVGSVLLAQAVVGPAIANHVLFRLNFRPWCYKTP
jgi:hypothetical protein